MSRYSILLFRDRLYRPYGIFTLSEDFRHRRSPLIGSDSITNQQPVRETNAATAHFSFEIVLYSILLQNGKYASVQPPFQTIENGQMNFGHFNTQCCWLQAETILTWFTFYHAVDVNHSEKFWKSYIIHLCSTKNMYKKKHQRHFLWLNSKHYRTLKKVE